jgi:hypothetical protein
MEEENEKKIDCGMTDTKVLRIVEMQPTSLRRVFQRAGANDRKIYCY